MICSRVLAVEGVRSGNLDSKYTLKAEPRGFPDWIWGINKGVKDAAKNFDMKIERMREGGQLFFKKIIWNVIYRRCFQTWICRRPT